MMRRPDRIHCIGHVGGFLIYTLALFMWKKALLKCREYSNMSVLLLFIYGLSKFISAKRK